MNNLQRLESPGYKANYMAGNSESHFYFLGENKMNDTDNQQKRLMDTGWLIGILEGEGCFTLQGWNGSDGKGRDRKRTNYSPLIQITNTNPAIIIRAQQIIKDLGLACRVYAQKQNSYRICFRVVIMGFKRVKRFLDLLLPLITCRAEQANCLSEFVNLRLSKPIHAPYSNEEDEIADRLKRLNRPYLFSETARLPQELLSIIRSNLKETDSNLAMIQSDLHGDMQAASAAVAICN